MLGAQLNVSQYIDRLQTELARLHQPDIVKLADLIYQAWENGRFVFIFGNGGSGTTASHFSEDLGKSTLRHRSALEVAADLRVLTARLVGAEYVVLDDLNSGAQKPVQIRFSGADSRSAANSARPSTTCTPPWRCSAPAA